MRTYGELSLLPTFEERFKYLKLDGKAGEMTFGFDRYINQKFYRSPEWKSIRDQVIIRDNGCDLGMEGYEIYGRIIIHHMNPISLRDINDRTEFLMNLDYLITVSHETHNAIHYGDENLTPKSFVERTPNDMCPWKR